MWLLDWLIARYINVFDWFGERYWQVRNLINSIPGYINGLGVLIVGYYNAAVNAIQNAVWSFYYGVILPALNSVNNAWAGVLQTLTDLRNRFFAWIASIPPQLEALKNSVIGWIRSTYDAVIASLSLRVNEFINVTLPTLRNDLNALLNFRVWLAGISSILLPAWMKEFVDTWGRIKNNVVSYASNPTGSILGFLWEVGLQFFGAFLAYQLGTVKYSLPALPSWGGNTVTQNVPLPENAGTLARPLNNLYISGYNYSDTHHGVDYGAQRGEPVYAAHDGSIQALGFSSVGYGEHLDLAGNPFWSRYGHLQSYNVSLGQSVSKGQVIGFADSTGNSTGDHLHFELKINGVYVNPVNYIS